MCGAINALQLALALVLEVAIPERERGEAPLHRDSSTAIWRSHRVCGVNCLYALLRARRVDSSYDQLLSELTRNDALTSLVALRDAAVARGLTGFEIGQ